MFTALIMMMVDFMAHQVQATKEDEKAIKRLIDKGARYREGSLGNEPVRSAKSVLNLKDWPTRRRELRLRYDIE